MLKNNCGIQNMGRIGYDISKTETRLFSTSGYSSVYGELTKRGVHKMLKMVNGNNKIFVDLGSGTGNVILHARTVHTKWKKTIGIELSHERHDIAKRAQKRMKGSPRERTTFIQGDMMQYSMSEVDIIYISNLCFDEKINRQLGKKLDKEVKDSAIIFASKPIYLTVEHVMKVHKVEQTWGDDSILLQYIVTK